MLLNAVERALMNNPVRAAIQRRFEARRLLRMGGAMRGGRALEIGCGRGVGVELVLDVFGADEVDAFDLDASMVELARTRLASRGDRVRLWTGDAEHVTADDETYDAVFDFGIIHHVPDWRQTLREVARVMKPGARFYAEEILRSFIVHPLVRRVVAHPQDDRFDAGDFARGLADVGLELRARRDHGHHVAWFVADKPLRS